MTNSNAIPDAATAPDFRMLRPWLAVDEPDNQGEWAMHCPLHEDRNASASVNFEKSLWRCFAGCPDGEVGKLLWQLEQMGVEGGGTTVTAKGDRGGFTADVVDLHTGKRRRPQKLPSPIRVDGWHNALMRNDERLSELFEKRGLIRETVESFKLGWDEEAEAYTIPFVEDGKIVNVKWYRVSPRGEQRKMWGVTGHNGARLYPGPPEDNGEPVLICSGEMDTLLAIQHGFEAVTGSGGEGTWRDEWNRHFTGRTVPVAYDRDKAGDEGFEIVRQQLAGKAAEVRKVVLPLPWREKDGLDLTDYYLNDPENFALNFDELMDNPDESLPEIMTGEPLVTQTPQALRALDGINRPPSLFQRERNIVEAHHQIGLVSDDRLRYHLTHAAEWKRWGKRSGEVVPVPDDPKMGLVKNLQVAHEQWGFPELDRVVDSPVYAMNGSLRTQPGYDPDSRTLYRPQNGLEVPAVPEDPDDATVQEAIRLVDENVLVDFPLVGDASRAHAYAMMVEPFVRAMINGPTPMYDVEAAKPGTGKGKLVRALLTPSQGDHIPTTTWRTGEEEMNKRITTHLSTADPVVWFDNVPTDIDVASAELASVLTADRWTGRILQYSKNETAAVRCLWVLTGNNPTFVGEIRRRVIPIRMESPLEDPERRDPDTLTHPDLEKWVRCNRGRLIWAACVLVNRWLAEGRPSAPKSIRPIGSFEAWRDVLGGILDVVEIDGFLDNLLTAEREPSDDEVALRSILDVMVDVFGVGGEFSAHDVLAHASSIDGYMQVFKGKKYEGMTDRTKMQSIGRFLTGHKGQNVGGLKIVKLSKSREGQFYRIEIVEGA